ncbi:MAG TPA: hypothetical protein VMY42_12125 [Thermoguttaceae bacterium]|nr:hypothetical protein [Thermoguttaceae bacterium]
MLEILPHQQIILNELEEMVDAHSVPGQYDKIDWSNFLAFLTKLIETLLPIIIPLLVKPPEELDKSKP